MAIEYGNSASAIQVHISFSIPVATLLHPGPRIYGQEDRHPSEIQGLAERRRKTSLPGGDDELLRSIQELLELTEAVQGALLDSIADGQVQWRVQRPGTEA